MDIKFRKKGLTENQYFIFLDGKKVGEVWKPYPKQWQADNYRQNSYYGGTRKEAAERLVRELS